MPTSRDSVDRKVAEQRFHNERELLRMKDDGAHDTQYSNRKFYSVSRASKDFMDSWLRANCKNGARVLSYCCGTGGQALEIAKLGAEVVGIDISDVCIESARTQSVSLGLAEHCRFEVMDAERTTFADKSFDVIVASGCLHHLDLEAAYRELARVLKPDGLILCNESLADNPVIMAYRKLTPHLRTAYEVEHILSVKDVQSAKRYFNELDLRFFHFSAIAAVPFRSTMIFNPLLSVLDRIDSVLARIPLIQKMAWQSVFVLAGPKP